MAALLLPIVATLIPLIMGIVLMLRSRRGGDRAESRPALLAGGVFLIVLAAGCFTGALIGQRASVRAAREGARSAEDARDRANEAIEAAIARGRAEALEHAETMPEDAEDAEGAEGDEAANDEVEGESRE